VNRLLTFLVVTAMAVTVHVEAFAADLSGKWEMGLIGARIEADITHTGNAVKGVVWVPNPGAGRPDTYHFSGTVNGSQIVASHTDGHVFSGEFQPDGRIVGTLRTRGGHRVPVTAMRR
jgi:hypothetical protein